MYYRYRPWCSACRIYVTTHRMPRSKAIAARDQHRADVHGGGAGHRDLLIRSKPNAGADLVHIAWIGATLGVLSAWPWLRHFLGL